MTKKVLKFKNAKPALVEGNIELVIGKEKPTEEIVVLDTQEADFDNKTGQVTIKEKVKDDKNK